MTHECTRESCDGHPANRNAAMEEELNSLRRRLGLDEQVAAVTKTHLYRRIETLQAQLKLCKAELEEMARPKTVFIPEAVDDCDNPWDGRTRYGIHFSLESALKALKHFGDDEDPLIATPSEYAYNGSIEVEAAWMVHRRSSPPSSEGMLWIFEETTV